MGRQTDPRDFAAYLVDIIGELKRIADANGMRRLSKLLDWALREAVRQRDDT